RTHSLTHRQQTRHLHTNPAPLTLRRVMKHAVPDIIFGSVSGDDPTCVGSIRYLTKHPAEP
ncbi:MAG: hypothetical protein M3460_15760, partial [Actinomycetota bacterium]|nr:hypothetical protein [Actinomycetota bacterium]